MRLFNFHEIVAHIFVGTIFELDVGELCLYASALCVLLLSCPPRSAVSPAALSVCARSRKKKNTLTARVRAYLCTLSHSVLRALILSDLV